MSGGATPTAFAQIVLAMQAALQSAPAVAPHIMRARVRQLPEQMATAVVVRPLRAAVDTAVGAGTPLVWATGVQVECYARGSVGCPVDVTLDALLERTVTRLRQDCTLGGLVGDLEPKTIDWDFDVDGAQTACATVIFNVPHATGAGVLT